MSIIEGGISEGGGESITNTFFNVKIYSTGWDTVASTTEYKIEQLDNDSADSLECAILLNVGYDENLAIPFSGLGIFAPHLTDMATNQTFVIPANEQKPVVFTYDIDIIYINEEYSDTATLAELLALDTTTETTGEYVIDLDNVIDPGSSMTIRAEFTQRYHTNGSPPIIGAFGVLILYRDIQRTLDIVGNTWDIRVNLGRKETATGNDFQRNILIGRP